MTEKKKDKRPRGRPKKNEIVPIPAPAELIAATIFHAADKKIVPLPVKDNPKE